MFHKNAKVCLTPWVFFIKLVVSWENDLLSSAVGLQQIWKCTEIEQESFFYVTDDYYSQESWHISVRNIDGSMAWSICGFPQPWCKIRIFALFNGILHSSQLCCERVKILCICVLRNMGCFSNKVIAGNKCDQGNSPVARTLFQKDQKASLIRNNVSEAPNQHSPLISLCHVVGYLWNIKFTSFQQSLFRKCIAFLF